MKWAFWSNFLNSKKGNSDSAVFFIQQSSLAPGSARLAALTAQADPRSPCLDVTIDAPLARTKPQPNEKETAAASDCEVGGLPMASGAVRSAFARSAAACPALWVGDTANLYCDRRLSGWLNSSEMPNFNHLAEFSTFHPPLSCGGCCCCVVSFVEFDLTRKKDCNFQIQIRHNR